MLTNAQADNKMARQFLQLANQLAPGTPATLVHLAQVCLPGDARRTETPQIDFFFGWDV